MHHPRLATFLILLALASPTLAQTGDPVPAAWRAVSEDGPWVVKIRFDDRATVQALVNRIDVWGVSPDRRSPGRGTLEAAIDAREVRELLAEGFRLELDEPKTLTLGRLGIPLKAQVSGIPGFPCYRTVEETYATAQAIVAAHPDLATWTDIGDSWEKTQDPGAGWDINVLKLTQSAVSGPKPVFFANFAIHAREYTTAELGTRFAEMLVGGYGTDPDVTWLLDHHEVHLVLQSNPDGRKRAETGLSWRKNTDNDYCSNSNSRGIDLNRNFEFQWACCGGSSSNQCSLTFRGPSPASEPEVQAIQSYVAQVFPDQRAADLSSPSPDDATGVAIDIHSYGRLVLWPWGFTNSPAPGSNGTAFTTFGRKLAWFNGHAPQQAIELYATDGTTDDFYYGELGVAGLAFELGTQFFESCSTFENNILQDNLDSLLYAAKVARTPFLTPAGPDATGAVATPQSVTAGELVLLTATVDDTRFNNSNGTEATQTIAAAEAFVGTPPWGAGAVAQSMSASDGTFDEGVEGVEVTIDTTGLTTGRHMLFVRATDTAGNEGVVAAAFLDVDAPCTTGADCDDGLFCNGVEICDAGTCNAGSDPCPGQSCDEAGDLCVPLICDDDGVCESGEDCSNCAGDCPSLPLPSWSCGNSLCEAGDGEDCVSCPGDCNGVQGGKPSNRFCCGFGGENPAGCGDSACTTGGFSCTETPVGGGGSTCCGDLVCESPEDSFNCELDCGPPPICGDLICNGSEDACSCPGDCGAPPASEVGLCTDGADNDCDLDVDCADADCDGIDPACLAVDCSTFGDKSSCNAQADCRWNNRDKVCVPN